MASGVFPRTWPFRNTSASAGVDRISRLPRRGFGGAATAPDAGLDGAGAGEDVMGRSTVVSSTPAAGSRTATGVGVLRRNPTATAARIPNARNMMTIGHRRLGVSEESSAVSKRRDGPGIKSAARSIRRSRSWITGVGSAIGGASAAGAIGTAGAVGTSATSRAVGMCSMRTPPNAARAAPKAP